MTTYNRATKPNGGTDWADGDQFLPADINADLNNAATVINGGLDNNNLSGSAGITAANIAAGTITNTEMSTSAAIDPAKVDDYSTDDTEHNTTSDPGDSDTNTLPTDMTDELEQLRFGIRKATLGIGAKVTDGTSGGLASDGAAAWFDGSVIGDSVIKNGAFLDSEAESSGPTAPDGWTVASAPSTLTTVALDAEMGSGEAIHIVDAGAGARDGIQQTLAGLKADSLYLIVAAVKPITTDWNLRTTGATASGVFQNLDLVSASGSGAWELLSGVIKTDSTPTDIVVQLLAEQSGSEAHLAFCQAFPLGNDPGDRCPSYVSRFASSSATTSAGIQSDTEMSVVVPGPGYTINVTAGLLVELDIGSGELAYVNATIGESTGGAFTTQTLHQFGQANGGVTANTDIRSFLMTSFTRESPVPGTKYTYKLVPLTTTTGSASVSFTNSIVATDHFLRIEMFKNG